MAASKDNPPARKAGHVGIRPKWSGGKWKWYARRRVGGREHVGPLRTSQKRAFEDYLALRQTHQSLPKEILTLLDGLGKVIEGARRRGVQDETIEGQLKVHGTYLCEQLGEETRLTAITTEVVEAFVTRALRGMGPDGRPYVNGRGTPSGPRKARTLREKDLQLLSAIFKAAGLESPVKSIGNMPRKEPRKIDPFKMSEVGAILDRMRHEEFTDKYGKVLDCGARAYHADLVEFMVLTAIRTGELMRLHVDDVSPERKGHPTTIAIEAKDRSNPRDVQVLGDLVPVVERLVEYATKNNGGYFVPPRGKAYLGNLFRVWKKRLGEPRLNGRRLRQTAITGYLISGATLLETMEFAGHKDANTTALYLASVEDQKPELAARFYGTLRGAPDSDEDQ